MCYHRVKYFRVTVRKTERLHLICVLDRKRSERKRWLDFIVACRSSRDHEYDVVIGAMANDQIYNYISDYIDGVITREQFWVLVKFKHPTHQINFSTEAALKCLEYRGYEEVKVSE